MVSSNLGLARIAIPFFLLMAAEAVDFNCFYATPPVGGHGGKPFNDLFNLTATRFMFMGYKMHHHGHPKMSHGGRMIRDAHMSDYQDDPVYPQPDSGLGAGADVVFDDEVLEGICISSGSRVDALRFVTNVWNYSHGGTGGTTSCHMFAPEETVSEIGVCTGKKRGTYSDRIFHISFNTTLNNRIYGGTTTENCTGFPFPSDYHLLGMYGRSGAEIDRIGFIFTKECD